MPAALPARLLGCLLLCLGACDHDEARSPLDDLPVNETLRAGVAAPVDIFRDEHGVPHIYGHDFFDVVHGQGYVMAQDRLVQMDLLRHLGSGTLAELLGSLDESLIDRDIGMRVHHLRRTADEVLAELRASQRAEDREIVGLLQHFADGVNAYLQELQSSDRRLPAELALLYDPRTTAPWTPTDSLVLARFQAFDLSFDASSELGRTQAEAAAYQTFDQAADPDLRSRRGLANDLYLRAPLAPAYILPDATGCGGAGTGTSRAPVPAHNAPATRLYDFAGLLPALHGLGLDHTVHEARGSNNWVVAPRLSGSGKAIVANDTHLSLLNPAVFYLSHLVVRAPDGLNLMGVQFPGLPGVVLGMNQHLAWGSTTTYADVTDLYEEKVAGCGAGGADLCVTFRGQQVPLVKRVEEIAVGRLGKIDNRLSVTFYDVPHHGPLLPHIDKHQVAPPARAEISVRYTGYRPTHELRAVLKLDRARSVQEAMAALEADFSVGSQNWVLADREGHIGWTDHVELPLRPAGARPFLVLPGDGSAEWMPQGVPAEQQPRIYDPSCGFIVTANNDPLGPGAALYHGWDYDVGGRAYRITSRLKEERDRPERLTPEKMQDIQADHRSFLGERLLPLLLTTAQQLLEERRSPGTYADLAEVARGLDAGLEQQFGALVPRLQGWKLGVPSGLAEEASAGEASESIAATVFNVWLMEFHARTLSDEFAAIDMALKPQGQSAPRPGSSFQRKLLLAAALSPERLTVGRQDNGDSLLFDDLRTPGHVESKREIAGRALAAALTALVAQLGPEQEQWQWGRVHRLTLDPILPLPSLKLPSPKDPLYPSGVPRHGDLYGVDAAVYPLSSKPPKLLEQYAYSEGPAIRFVAELGPDGPRAWNVLPGGEVFDPSSPHYADQFELWRRNQAFPLPFTDADVYASASREAAQGTGNPAHVQLTP